MIIFADTQKMPCTIPCFCQVTGIPENNYESFQIVQYKQGQFYKPHHDSSNANKDRVSGHRILTFVLYLNDVWEGGETRFANLGISVIPQKVSLAIRKTKIGAQHIFYSQIPFLCFSSRAVH